MKLLNEFFRIVTITGEDSPVFETELNPSHFIFGLHFPGNPITPGVCQAEMLVECMEQYEQRPLFLKAVKSIKYAAVLSPAETKDVTIRVSRVVRTNDDISFNATLSSNDRVFSKIALSCNYQTV